MKNIKYRIPLYLFFTLLLFNSCDELKFGDSFLDQQPEQVGINIDTVFTSKHYAMQVLTTAYTTLPYGLPSTDDGGKMGGDLLDAITDLSYSTLGYAGASSLYYNGAYSAGKEKMASKCFFTNGSVWKGIRYAWIMIENVDRVPDMTSIEKANAKAQAKLIIATHYAELFRNFGGIPFLDHAIKVNEDTHYTRATVEQSVKDIVTLIDEALPDLEWKVADSNDDGRMTKAYAMGLKLRVLLFAASPLFNSPTPYLDNGGDNLVTWYGNYDEQRWKDAEAAGKEFMEALAMNGGYDLVQPASQTETGYRDAFRTAYFTRDNGEVLLSVRKNYKNNYSSCFCGDHNNFAGNQCPTLAYANMFGMADGSDFPSNFDWANAPVDPFANRDPRLYETILTNGRPYKNRKSELYVGGRDRKTASSAGTGLLLYKFSQDFTSATSIGAVDSWPAMRLAEVYLSYAEAINEANGGPTSVAYDLVNKVRSRVGLKALASGMSKEQFRKAVLHERACEFGYEEVRWYDIARWKDEAAFAAPVQGVNMIIDKTKPTGYRYEIFTITPERAWKTQWSPKWYLSAIPVNEIDKRYGLVQNPGW